MMAEEESGRDAGGYCKPARLVHCSSKPLKILRFPVELQYTLTRKQCEALTVEGRQSTVLAPVRVMGVPQRDGLYVVAKDICLLIHTRKGNVAKTVGQFSPVEKARMRVLCPRANGCVSTHMLLVLTLAGVERLCRSSRFPRTQEVLAWFNHEVSVILAEGALFMQQQGVEQAHEQSTLNFEATSLQSQQDIQAQNFRMQSGMNNIPNNPYGNQYQVDQYGNMNMGHPQRFGQNSFQPDISQLLGQLRLDIQQAVRMQLSSLQHEIDVRVHSQVDQQMAAAQLHIMSDTTQNAKKTEMNPSLYMDVLKQQQQQLQNQAALIQMQQMKMHEHAKQHMEFQAEIQLQQATIQKHSAFLQRQSELIFNHANSGQIGLPITPHNTAENTQMDMEEEKRETPLTNSKKRQPAVTKDDLSQRVLGRLKELQNGLSDLDQERLVQMVHHLQNRKVTASSLSAISDRDLRLIYLQVSVQQAKNTGVFVVNTTKKSKSESTNMNIGSKTVLHMNTAEDCSRDMEQSNMPI